ncbi:MAG TPA: cellulase family glycosylhydrolase [Balneolaceae bacterium]|nr:cellulase family glycosylhydrolase [Balneolaceae bacterium]
MITLVILICLLGSAIGTQAFSATGMNKSAKNPEFYSATDTVVTLKDGHFAVNGKPFIPIGFNYWPTDTGVQCWKNFDIHEWEKAFKAMHKRGFNAVRMFLLWQDFQPAPDSVNRKDLEHLKEVSEAAARNHIWLIPTLFQGWMSGVNFVPSWASGKNYIRNPQMRKAMTFLAGRVAKALKNENNILAVDLANEIDVIQPNVKPSDVSKWTQELSHAIKSERPGTIVTNGSAVRGASKSWSFSAQNVDLYSMHSYPFWNPVIPQRLSDYAATVAFGFNSAFARSFGPAMLEEFGFAFGGDSKLMGHYLRANAASAFLAGANGFLYWCWSDFTTTRAPYQTTPSESSLGYVNINGQPKIWSHYYDQFKNFVHKYSAYHPVSSEVVLYRPELYSKGGDQADQSLATAYLALAANGITPRIQSHISDNDKLIVVPYSKLTISEIKKLNHYVSQGGHLIVTDVNMSDCSQYWEKLTSTRMTGIAQNISRMKVSAGSGEISLHNVNKMPVLKPMSKQASIVLTSASPAGQVPMIIQSNHRKGRVVQFVGPIQHIIPHKYTRPYVDLWHKLLNLSGYKPQVQLSKPYIQSGIIKNNQGDKKLLLINHLDNSSTVTVKVNGHQRRTKIGPQNYKVLTIK